MNLPIEKALPDLEKALQAHRNIILIAEPGAGKTTRVPLWLLEQNELQGKKIILLEPRRIAAQRAAAFMAQQLGEKVGETVGYRIRGDSKVRSSTRIEVVTEGVLTRLLQDDPSLPNVGMVIFDEFHERSIHADLGLALSLNVQEHLRDDLKILIMSATLDAEALRSIIPNSGIVISEGRSFPVETRYLEQRTNEPVEAVVQSAIRRALRDEKEGDLLVFLPGQWEIKRVESRLLEGDLPSDIHIHTLYGEAPSTQQQAALSPAPIGHRKVILSTSIAETSLTIDGVRIVIDSGLVRGPKFDPRRGMTGLVTAPVSQATADQRRGRAGRQYPGVCYRLWTEHQHRELPLHPSPEILVTDLAPLALDFAKWGAPSGEGLHFLDPPPLANLDQARSLLVQLGAVDPHGRITLHGIAMSRLPVHPRLAHMLLRGKELGYGTMACNVAALLEERDILARGSEIDLHSRWFALRNGNRVDRNIRERIQSQALRFRKLVQAKDDNHSDDNLGILLAFAYPERIAKRRDQEGDRYQFSGGAGGRLPKGSSLSRYEYLAVGEVDGIGNDVRIYLAEPLRKEALEIVFSDRITMEEEIRWSEREEAVVASRRKVLGAITLSEQAITPDAETIAKVMLDGIREMGLSCLPWEKQSKSLKIRSEWLRTRDFVNEDWPNLNEGYLLESLEQWLLPHIGGMSRRVHLQRLDLLSILQSLFTYKQLQMLDQLAPTHLVVPTGSRIPLDYESGQQPILAVRLQEMFGQTETPSIAGGAVKVLLHLLSPAHRPLAVTQDLPSFWKNAYPEVRKDMRGQYPKHVWPENPIEAKPTRRAKPR